MTEDFKERVKAFFRITEDVSEEELIELMDEAVTDLKAYEASVINNSGPEAQLEYLES